jgi:hypothetical protein
VSGALAGGRRPGAPGRQGPGAAASEWRRQASMVAVVLGLLCSLRKRRQGVWLGRRWVACRGSSLASRYSVLVKV